MKTKRKTVISIIISFVIVFLISLIFLPASPLHSIGNTWNDTNAMLTVGQAWKNGIVPYKEIFEQRGPIMFFYYLLANLVSSQGYLGLFIIEIANLFFLYFISFKFLKLIKKSLILNAFLASFLPLAFIASAGFEEGGSPEEFAAPWVLLGIYLIFKAYKKNYLNWKTISFLIGICASLVFWIKYSIVGSLFFCAIYLLYLFIKTKRYKLIWQGLVFSLIGFAIISLIIIIYFASQHAFHDLLFTYFTVNSKYYAPKSLFLKWLLRVFSLNGLVLFNLLYWILGISSLIFIKKRINSFLTFLFIWADIGIASFIFYAGSLFAYGNLILETLLLMPMMLFLQNKLASSHWNLNKTKTLSASFGLIFLLSLFLIPRGNVAINSWKDEAIPKLAKTIKNHSGHKPVSILTANSIDPGIGRFIPLKFGNKYFEKTNIDNQNYPQELNGIKKETREQTPDYIIWAKWGYPYIQKTGLGKEPKIIKFDKRYKNDIFKYYKPIKNVKYKGLISIPSSIYPVTDNSNNYILLKRR